MVALKTEPIPPTNVHDLARLQKRVLAGLGGDAVTLLRGGQGSIGTGPQLLAALPVAIYTTDAEGRITFFNEVAAALWGQRPVLGSDRYCGSWQVQSADGTPVPHDRTPVALALDSGKAVAGAEQIALRPDGSRVAIAAFPTLLRDGEGLVTGAINMLVDLTASKAAEAELHESEAHGRSANELNPQMPWTADTNGRVLEFSERWCNFTGQTHDEAMRSGWQRVVNAEDMPRVRAAMVDALTSDGAHDTRFRVRTGSGEERWVRARAFPRRDATGEIIRWYGTTEDIHDSVLAEAEALAAGDRHLVAQIEARAAGDRHLVAEAEALAAGDRHLVAEAEALAAGDRHLVAEAEARAAGVRHLLASEAANDVGWDLDVARDVVAWSPALRRLFGLWPAPAESNRAWWKGQIHPDDRARISELLAATMAGTGTRLRAEYRFRRADGSYAHVLDRGSLIRNDEGQVVRAIGAMIDLSERKETEQALRHSEERFRLAASAAGLGIADIDMVTQVNHWSDEMRVILGVGEDAPACLETYAALVHADDRAAALDHHLRWLRGDTGIGHIGVHRIVRPSDGALRWISSERHAMRNDDGALIRVIVTNKDITEEKTAQDRITWAATHDAVTGLPNRSMFQAQLEGALAHGLETGRPVALLLIDLDNFKTVNDTFGHLAGDRALAGFAARIGEAMPEGAILVRFGGDEFAMILPGSHDTAAAAVGADLVDRLLRPISVGARNIDLRASIGVSAFPDHGENGSDLIQNADLALYAAKTDGRSKVRIFDPSLRTDLKHQLTMLSQARAALDHGWIRPFYQPKISLATGRTTGFEALLRWRDPRTGLKLPETIACAFDDTELAGLLGEAMVLAVLADLRAWRARGIDVGKIAINASAAEFREPGFADRLLARLAAFEVPAAMLELEITETAFLGDCAANVVVALEALRAAGMTIALDDFGTGFSSLSHLRNFPVDTIKIDRSFVADLTNSAEDRAIIEAVLRLGDALGMTTVAEGVETQAQADYLRAHGCTLAQGFLFDPALDAAGVPAAAQAHHRHGDA